MGEAFWTESKRGPEPSCVLLWMIAFACEPCMRSAGVVHNATLTLGDVGGGQRLGSWT